MPDYTIDPSGLSGDDETKAAVDAASNNPFRLPNKQDLKTVRGYSIKAIAQAPGVPTGLYSLASDVLKAATKATVAQDNDAPILAAGRDYLKYMTPFGIANAAGFDGLPGAEGAGKFTDTVNKNALDFGSFSAGKELRPGLVGNNSMANKVGTGLDILGSMIPITGGPIKSGFEALKNINTGIKAIDKTVPVAAEIAAFMTPLVPTDSASAMIAGNALIGGSVQAAQDTLSQPATSNAPPDPEFQAAMDQFIQGTNEAHDKLDQHASDRAAVAVDGVGQVSNDMHTIKAGFDLTDYPGLAAAVTAFAVAASVAWHRRDAIRGASLRMFGGKEFSKDALRDSVTMKDATTLSIADVMKSEAVDASTPLIRNTNDPEHIRAMFEQVGVAKDVHFNLLMEDGKFAGGSNITLNQSLKDTIDHIKENIAAKGKLDQFNDVANAIDERGNRNRVWLKNTGNDGANVNDPLVSAAYRRWITSPGTSEADTVFNMSTTPYRSLDTIINTGLADPDIKLGLDMLTDIGRKSLQYRLEQGSITRREYNDLNRTHSIYFPTRQDVSHMAPLNLSSGAGRLEPGNTTAEVIPALAQTVREVAAERLRTAFMMEATAKNMPFIGKNFSADAKNVKNMDKVVAWRDVNANRMLTEVSDPMIRHALAVDAGTGAIRMNTGIMRWLFNAPSRFLEATTTHPLVGVLGSPFSPMAMEYGILATQANKQPGMSYGYFDKFLQDKLGFKSGLRGDPSARVQTYIQAGINIEKVFALHGGKALENIAHSSWIAPSMGAATLDKIGQAMSNHYKASILYETKAQGLHGGANWSNSNLTDSMKGLDRAFKPSILEKATPGVKATFNLIYDLSRAIADSPQTTYYKQNKGRVSQELLTTRTRNVMGDPSKSGLAKSEFGQAVTGLTNFVPWGGVTLQTSAKILESAMKNPLGTTMAIFNTVAVPAIISYMWNVNLGPEYVKYQHEMRSADLIASSHYFGIPGHLPEEGAEWAVDQPLRPFKVMVDVLWGHLYGLHDGSIFKPENDLVRKAHEDGVSTRYGNWGGGDAMTSALGQILPAVPPIINLALAAGGKEQFRSLNTPATPIRDVNKNAGASDSSSSTIDNKWFGYPVSASIEATMSNSAGRVGQIIYEMLTAHFQGRKDGLSTGDQFLDFQDRFGMRLGNSTRQVSGLWRHAATLSPSQEASAKTLQEQMEGMRKLDATSQKLRGLSGSGDLLSGAKGRQIDSLAGSGPVRFADQQMQALAFSAQRFVAVYDKQFSGHIKDLYEARSSILSSEKVAPDVKRTMMNDNAKQIVDANRAALSALEQWKWNVSRPGPTGFNRDIDLRNIKLDQPITQFKQLLN